MPEVHARFSPSSAKRRIHCPRSLLFEEQFPDDTSPFAEEGTAGHSLAEYELRKWLKVKGLKKPKSDYYTDELVAAVGEYVQYVKDEVCEAAKQGLHPILLVEQKLNVSDYADNCFGTADAVVIAGTTLHIIDLKLGRGVEVSAEHNEQLMCYGLGGLRMFEDLYDFNTVKLSIVQPRINNLSTWSTPATELLTWGEQVLKPKAAQALAGEGDFASGDWCRFCKARQVCRARAQENLKLIQYEFAEPEALENEEIGEILTKADQLKSWADDIYTYAQNQAILHGVQYDGYKLVEGRTNRKYTDVEAVERIALDAGYTDIYETNLIGITGMEKLMGKKAFADLLGDYAVKPPGKLTLVPVSDKREEVIPAQVDFKEE